MAGMFPRVHHFRDSLGSFLRLGVTAFGGPAMVAYIRDLAVNKKRWLSAETFADGTALVPVNSGRHGYAGGRICRAARAGDGWSLGVLCRVWIACVRVYAGVFPPSTRPVVASPPSHRRSMGCM